jgi:hypothetical protein
LKKPINKKSRPMQTTSTPAFAALRRARQNLLAAAVVGVVAFTSTSTKDDWKTVFAFEKN